MKWKASLQAEFRDHEHTLKTYHSSRSRNLNLMNTAASDQPPAWDFMMRYRMRRKPENYDPHLERTPNPYHSSLFRNLNLMHTAASDQPPAWGFMMGYRMRRKRIIATTI